MRNTAKIIDLKKVLDARGNLSIIEENSDIPFKIERVHWIYDVPGGESRGGHAYKNTEEFIVALSGSFDVILDNGDGKKQNYHLNRSYMGLYVPKMIWREIDNFSTNAVALVVSSTLYDSDDYIRNFEQFIKNTMQ